MMFDSESTKLEITIRFEDDFEEDDFEEDDFEEDDFEEDDFEEDDFEEDDFEEDDSEEDDSEEDDSEEDDGLIDRYPNEEDADERAERYIKDMEKAMDKYW